MTLEKDEEGGWLGTTWSLTGPGGSETEVEDGVL